MIPRKMKITTLAALAAGGMAIGLAGPVSASHLPYVSLGAPGTVGNPGSTASYQMFGTIQCYDEPGAQPVQHQQVTGTLNGGLGTPPTATVTTNDAGEFRLNGNFTWAGTILAGGNVTIPLPDGTTYTITLSDFEDHRVGGALGTSAGPFRVQLSDAYCDTLPNG